MRKLILVFLVLMIGCAATGPKKPLSTGKTINPDSYVKKELLAKIEGGLVAVLPFECANQTLSKVFAEDISFNMGRMDRFTMLERMQIDKVFSEQDIDTNRIDDAAAVRIGKMLGAKGVVVGSLYDGINARLVDTQTGAHAWNAALPFPNGVKVTEKSNFTAASRSFYSAAIVATLSKASMGITIREVEKIDSETRRTYGINRESGIVILNFTPNSLARSAGLDYGDVIYFIDNAKIDGYTDLVHVLLNKNPGDLVKVYIARGGEEKVIDIQLIPKY